MSGGIDCNECSGYGVIYNNETAHKCDVCSGTGQRTLYTAEELEQARSEGSKWIRVKDGLPELGSVVLAFRRGDVRICSYRMAGGLRQKGTPDHPVWCGMSGKVPTYWMPMPIPPKEEKESEGCKTS